MHLNISFLDWIVGYFIYFGLHHTLFLYLHAIPRRSVSMNLCVVMNDRDKTSKSFLENTYGQGKGIQFVAEDRLKGIEQLGFVKRQDQNIELTPLGFFIAKLHLIILKLWNLKANSSDTNV